MDAKGMSAKELHEKVPPNWYYQSLKIDPFQKYWHKSRFREIRKASEPTGGSVLDVGCADGMFSKVVYESTKPETFIGIDVLPKSVAWAKRHWKGIKNMKFRVADAAKIPFQKESFDAVFCLEVLEHVYDPKKVLEEFKRVLKKGGYGVFLVPSDNFLFRLTWFFWLHFYPRGWVWRDTHIQTYKDNYLPKLCEKIGYKIEMDKKFNLGMLHLVKVIKP